MDLSIVIVSWNVKPLLERCLATLTPSVLGTSPQGEGQSSLRCEVIVVDNASSDGSPDMVQHCFPWVRLLACDSNLGFVKGNNLGVAASSARHVLLLNPDTEVLGDALATMVAYMDTHQDVGVVGPKLLFPNGQVQPSRRRFPTLATALIESTVLQRCFSNHQVLRRYYIEDRSADDEQEVDWLVGACLLIRRKAWDDVGPFDERIFMYSEELDWCRRARSLGWRVVYLPSATIIHHEGQSSGQVMPARHIYFQSSKVYYFRKHHGRLIGETVRLFLLATYVYQVLIESGKWLLGHKRALRRERVSAYLRVLRSGLRLPIGENTRLGASTLPPQARQTRRSEESQREAGQ